jgi:hypothetical protein
MKQPLKFSVYLSSLIILLVFSFLFSCKKEVADQESQSFNNLSEVVLPAPTPCIITETDHHEDNIANNLNDFWANFSDFIGVENPTEITPNLEATLCYDKAVYFFHYVLHTAMVDPDTTYNEIDSFEFIYNLPVNVG